ncbi:hypothetical protein [Metabacillus fastidiosus]|uniref:Uncharacterized protein n=1 Tax=Metabacillus fastidiosus TaxID=1458 RepID=A0ABU6P1S9_9BACI|nr:hypothetical protein [Metabacillus fastidiosus]MED4402101.1 hypothetical protein [Metabacillus fastidiosus]
MKKIHATCSLCQHFDSQRSTCTLNNQRVDPLNDYDTPAVCQREGRFMRNMNVIPDNYHYFKNPEDVPFAWSPDFSRLPKDSKGVPLFVETKRGYERALPADNTVPLEGCLLVGVNKILTYQGQRDIIFDLGVEIALELATEAGVTLTILPEEENWPGDPKAKQQYKRKQGKNRDPRSQWMSDKPIERW